MPHDSAFDDVLHMLLYANAISAMETYLSDTFINLVFWNTYESLLQYDSEKQAPVPMLAESYSVSDDGKTWTFKLRTGVTFHDGTAFDSSDVKASIEHYQRVNKGSSFIWAAVKSVECPNPQTAILHLSYAAPIDLIASASLASQIISADALEKHGDAWLADGHEAGTGPYMLQSETSDMVILKQYPKYWGGWQGEHLSKAVIKRVAEAGTRRQMIESGECDITTDLTPEDVDALASNPSIKIIEAPAYKNLQISLLTTRKPLQDVRVRQALAYAYPYDEAVATAVGGYGQRDPSILPSTMWGSADNSYPYTTNLEKAKALLSEAGYPNGGFKLTALYTTGEEPKRKALELFKASLAELNIDLEIRSGPWDSVWQEAKGDNPPDLFCMWWWPSYVDPSDWLYNMYRTEADVYYNIPRYSNKQVDALIDEGMQLSATDRAAAATVYEKAQRLAGADVPWIVVLEAQTVYAEQTSFTGFQPNPAYDFVVPFYPCSRQ